MRIIEKIKEMRTAVSSARGRGATVAFVPTMGGLHQGHLLLVRSARRFAGEDGLVVVSVFVNPVQFSEDEDLGAYPRDFGRDAALLKEAGVQIIFSPSVEEIYPDGFSTRVDTGGIAESSLAGRLCGASRPGHFSGVATIVTKLFNIAAPDVAVFGLKDYQQQLIIKKLVKDLDMDIEIVTVETVREGDGLAMSSRNAYLDEAAREAALCVPRSLELACRLFAGGASSLDEIKQEMRALVEARQGVVVDYIIICEPETLEEATVLRAGLLVAIAVRVALAGRGAAKGLYGKGAEVATAQSVRLIDNCILETRRVKLNG